MTNKPMLSVERDLLEELRNVCGDPDLAEEANAILDKPSVQLHGEPVAVVMPERKTKADYSGYIEQFQSEAAALYNEALDDVARLNGVTP